jgi:hypothetical protein
MICADFDGDGFDDVVVGSPYKDNGRARNSGRVEVLYGGPGGLGSTRPGRVITQNSAGMRDRADRGDVFGFDLTWCFFDGDEYPDLAVGVPGENVGNATAAGAVHVIYGGPNGLSRRNQLITQNSRGMDDRAETFDFFGEYLTAIDVDGDSRCDLVVGVPSEDIGSKRDAGAVHVIFGSASGLGPRNQFIHRDSRAVEARATPFERFGAPLFFGDFIAGGGFEVVVGVPGQDVGRARDAGAIHILASDRRGLTGRGDFVVHRNSRGIAGRATTDEQFGRSVLAGQFDGDGLWDVAVGVPGQTVGRGRSGEHAGAVHFIFGNGRGLSQRDRVITQRTLGFPPSRGDFFGATLAGGDFDGDGLTDVAVGAPYVDWTNGNRVVARDGGAVHTILAGPNGPGRAGSQLLGQGMFSIDDGVSGAEHCDNFGNFNPGLGILPPDGVVSRQCANSDRSVDALVFGDAPDAPTTATEGPLIDGWTAMLEDRYGS